MSDVFKPFFRQFVIVFFNDVVVYNKDLQSHLMHLATMLETLEKNQLFANKSNCHFACVEIKYFRHLISKDGVRDNPKKLESMVSWPVPKIAWE